MKRVRLDVVWDMVWDMVLDMVWDMARDMVWDMVWDRASRKFSLTNIAVEDSLAEKLSVSQ